MKRVTMNRTRCVQFFWRKFCRLNKYYCAVNACRLVKATYRSKANKIQSQYRVYKFRNAIIDHILNKKARFLQQVLRKYL